MGFGSFALTPVTSEDVRDFWGKEPIVFLLMGGLGQDFRGNGRIVKLNQPPELSCIERTAQADFSCRAHV